MGERKEILEKVSALGAANPPAGGANQGASFSRLLQGRLASIEKRDWELWVLALSMVGILAVGYFFVIFPAVFLGQRTIFIHANFSSPLLVGQIALVLLFLIHLAHKHIQIRTLRAESIVEALQFELAHAQLMLDPLTQAFNRTALEEVISKELNRAKRRQTTLVFLYIDVDDLKRVNTRYGHLSGDLVLSEVGAVLKGCVRGSDYVIRMGGDEFLIVCTDTDLSGGEAVKRRVNMRTDRWNQSSPLEGFQLAMSIGVELFDGTRAFDEVLAAADAKMYTEKQARQANAKKSS
jgi:diguanylate cyclase (GGDEF)-like protein